MNGILISIMLCFIFYIFTRWFNPIISAEVLGKEVDSNGYVYWIQLGNKEVKAYSENDYNPGELVFPYIIDDKYYI